MCCCTCYRFSMKTSYQSAYSRFTLSFFLAKFNSVRHGCGTANVVFWLRFNLFTDLECSAFHRGYLQITINHSGYQIARLSIHFRWACSWAIESDDSQTSHIANYSQTMETETVRFFFLCWVYKFDFYTLLMMMMMMMIFLQNELAWLKWNNLPLSITLWQQHFPLDEMFDFDISRYIRCKIL